MKLKASILYSWFVKTVTYFLPNHPFFMGLRGFLYSLMMKKCGKNFQVASTVTITSLSGLEVGNNVYIAHNNVIIGTKIKIGEEVIIGPNCIISSGNHIFQNGSFRYGKGVANEVRIEDGSWVAGNCSVIGGAILPKQSILAAGAVLNKPMRDEKSIYGGVPARKIGEVK
ncbi:acyltransferase [Chryseobacterium sp. LC2016-27]|uniref:acyltransferase n=1 Tax=Chryseobacterium sp. LC2016-27 TaxID=2897326 RepID=UPI001E317E6A|nr:acyltransferase [Chryseobacterium sp. LC2016-27]MCD0457552.1 acyltransferase [Chryseobacterium sp. LC2016-27]